MEETCLAWRVHDDKDGLVRYQCEFVGGHKFYLPFRCPEKRIVTSELCSECYGKREKDKNKTLAQRKQNHPSRYWGIITDSHESILSVATFPFTELWLKRAKQYGISERSMAKAKKAIDKAKGIVVEETPVEKPVEKKKPRIKAEVKPRKKKEDGEPKVLPKAAALLQQSETETVEEVIMVKVQRFEHAGRKYYLNSTKYKLYDYQPDGGCKGLYQGRWDPETETIHAELVDSDAEG